MELRRCKEWLSNCTSLPRGDASWRRRTTGIHQPSAAHLQSFVSKSFAAEPGTSSNRDRRSASAAYSSWKRRQSSSRIASSPGLQRICRSWRPRGAGFILRSSSSSCRKKPGSAPRKPAVAASGPGSEVWETRSRPRFWRVQPRGAREQARSRAWLRRQWPTFCQHFVEALSSRRSSCMSPKE